MIEASTAVSHDTPDQEAGAGLLRHLAWPLGALGLLIPAASITLVLLDRSAMHSLSDTDPAGVILPIGFVVIGALLVSRRPRNRIGWICLGIGIFTGVEGLTAGYVFRSTHFHHLPLTAWMAWLNAWVLWLVYPVGLAMFLFLLFPDGRFQSRRWRRLGIVALALMISGLLLTAVQPSLDVTGSPTLRNPVAVALLKGLAGNNSFVWFFLWIGGIALLITAMVGTVLRTRRSTGELRRQLRWLGYAAMFTAACVFVSTILSLAIPNLPNGVTDLVIVLGFGFAVPGACGIAILKHGLYDLGLVVSKTLVYGALAAFFTIVYVGVVVGIGTAIGSTRNPFLTLAAAALIALAFNPVRDRAKRFANRMVYGKRATPYEVLSGFSERMAAAYSLEDVLPRMAAILGEGTGARQARVWLKIGDELRPAASWGEAGGDEHPWPAPGGELPAMGPASKVVPVRHQGDLLGALTVTKPPSEPLTAAEGKLVDDLAAQAGLVLRNVRLTEELRANLEELRASRQRIVSAQDAERRRLERNIHDGAQQQLVALAVKLNIAEQLVGRDVERERTLIHQMKAETTEALETIRDLARGIYPPLLADKGLAVALQAQARKSPLPVTVESDGISRYGEDAEAAVYFSVLEGLQNVAKYAEASGAVVRLSQTDGSLTFEVTDDGRGFDAMSSTYGTGLQGIADRLAALDGTMEVRSTVGAGTTLRGTVPVRGSEAPGG